MAVYLFNDSETIPLPHALHFLEPVQPDRRLTDPEKIAKSIEERTAEALADCSFDPDLCRLVALGHYVVGRDHPECFLARDEYEEREMLRAFWALYQNLNYRHEVKLVGFNSLKFDWPIMLRRSVYLDVETPFIDIDKYRTPHLDVWWHLTHKGAIKAHSLAFYRKRFGFAIDDPVDGSQIADLVKNEQWAEVEQHCLADIATTHCLANRLGLLKV